MTINNPVQTIQLQAIKNISKLNTRLSIAAINNRKPDLTVIDTIRGLEAFAAANVNRTIVGNMGTGFNIINVSMATLKNLRSQLEQVKQTVATLSGADDATIEIANKDYNTIIGQIFDTLGSTNFLGINLFDGTLANAPTERLAAQNLPLNASPFKIQTDANTIDTLDIAIPRLLPGDGRFTIEQVNDTFSPLFPVTDISKVALTRLSLTARVTGADAGAYDRQRLIIDSVIPRGVNAEQDYLNTRALGAYDSAKISFDAAGNLESVVNARGALTIMKNICTTYTLCSYNTEDIDAAFALVNGLVAGADEATTQANIDKIPHDPTINYAQRKFHGIATNLISLLALGENVSSRLDEIKALLSNVANDAKESRFTPLQVSGVNIAASRIEVTQIMNNAIGTLDKVISTLTGTGNSLTSARSATKALIVELDTAANKYTAADYNEIVSKLSQSSRALTTLLLCYAIQERIINSNVSSLTRLADTIPV